MKLKILSIQSQKKGKKKKPSYQQKTKGFLYNSGINIKKNTYGKVIFYDPMRPIWPFNDDLRTNNFDSIK